MNNKVIADFGKEWKKYNQNHGNSSFLKNELKFFFSLYFKNFPWERLPKNATGFDLGCGSGRWAEFVAPKVGKLICIDPAHEALEVAKKNLLHHTNCDFYNSTVSDMPIDDNSMDFGYSLGVLHHIEDTDRGIVECARKLKKNAPFLIYLYYAFDNKPFYYKLIWKITNPFRQLISRLPFPIKLFVTKVIASIVYLPLSRIAKLFNKFGFIVDNFPLSYYKDKSFYVMQTDSLDRFGTTLEKRFTKDQITKFLENAGISRIKFNDSAPYWCAIGFKD
mgnify:CR=1 FL=1